MKRLEPKLNLVQIQDQYLDAVEAAYSRWAHTERRGTIAGHYQRTRGAAWKTAIKLLVEGWTFTPEQARAALRQADEMITLRRHATEE